MNIIAASILLLGSMWLLLFFSNSGVLINGQKIASESGKNEVLKCKYFIATSIITVEYWYAPNGILGRAACPRVMDI